LDLTDINKEVSHIFEYIGHSIYGGSEGSVVDGYMAVVIEGIQKKGDHLPLYLDMFSLKANCFISINAEVKKVGRVVNIFGRIVQWVMDHEFDSSWIFQYFDTMKLSFIVRGYKNRNVRFEDNSIGLPGGQVGLLYEYIRQAELPGRYPFYHYYVLRKKGRKNHWVKKGKQHKVWLSYCNSTAESWSFNRKIALQVVIIESINGKEGRSYFFLSTCN
jgi:hypothetical protein